jgi:hypothetical protein
MRAFTYYDPDLEPEPAGPIIRLWELSWRANGWEPRLLAPRLARRHPDFKKDGTYWDNFWLAADFQEEQHGAMVDFRTFNNGLKPGDPPLCGMAWYLNPKNPKLAEFIGEFPEKKVLVHFSPEHTLADMLTLGPYDIGTRQAAQ